MRTQKSFVAAVIPVLRCVFTGKTLLQTAEIMIKCFLLISVSGSFTVGFIQIAALVTGWCCGAACRASADQKAGHIVSTVAAALGICCTSVLKETICLHMKMQINTKN